MTSVRVTVPASTANLGPGFDVLGLAVSLRNEVALRVAGRFRSSGEPVISVSVEGCGAGELPLGRTNLVVKAALRVFSGARKIPERLSVRLLNRVPLASGLGSSAAAAVGGLVGANELCGRPLTKDDILRSAAEMEGHPDNVAPALLGGLAICVLGEAGKVHVFNPRVRRDLMCVFCVPASPLLTRHARRVLPRSYSRADVVFSLSRAAMLAGLLQGGSTALFRVAMQDRIHQPYREKLRPGMSDAMRAAEKAGALGACLSGAGPTVLALVERGGDTERVGAAMCRAFERAGVSAQPLTAGISREGARVNGGR